MDGTVTVTRQSGDTIVAEVKETNDNAGAEDPGNGPLDDSSFTDFNNAKVYGTDLMLGKWYFEDSDATTTNIPGHTERSIVTRNFKFVPDNSAIGNLTDGEVRYSTITVKVMRSSNVISTESYTVSIYKAEKPVFRIFATDNSKSINEGGTITLNVVADADPGTTAVPIKYVPTNSKGLFLTTGDHNAEKDDSVTFTPDSGSSPPTWSGTFDFDLRNDNENDETDGIIVIKLKEPDASISSANYVTDPNNVAIVEVKDLTVPRITFENASAVNQGSDGVFTLTADKQPWEPLAIRFIPSNTSGNFLNLTDGDSGLPRTSPKITFSGSGTITGDLNIPTILDKANATGTISVTLLSDPSTVRETYQLSATEADHTKAVTVNRDAPTRTISVDNTAININEGETATVTFIADDDPGRSDLMIKYTPDETSADTTYLKDDGNGNGDNVTRTATLDFEEVNSRWVAEVEIETNKNDKDEIHGVITVMLDMPGGNDGYTRTTTVNEQSVTINVKDLTVPIITIADADDVTPGNAASFTLTADIQPKEGLTIAYTPTENVSTFLAAGGGTTGNPTTTLTPISFSGVPIVGTLSIPTQADANNSSGEISILLMDDSNTTDPSYKIMDDTDANTKKVRVSTNPIVEISIEERSETITEGGMQTVTLVADGNPNNSNLSISYKPTERSMNTSYLKAENNLGTGMSRTASNLTFVEDDSVNPSIWKATVTIMTNNDNEDGKDGVIEVVLDPADAQAGYTIAESPNDRIQINVTDATVPNITIEAAPNIEPTGIARFKLIASKLPHSALGIKYKPTETNTMYLNTDSGASGVSRIASPKIKFTTVPPTPPATESTYEGTLSIPTVLDVGNIGVQGTISVLLENDTSTNPSYQTTGTDAVNTKTVTIGSNIPVPTVEIEFEQTTMNIEEGDTAEIKVILDQDPVRLEFPIKVTPRVSGTNFLETKGSDGDGDERMEDLNSFTPVPNTDKFSATFEVGTTTNSNDEPNGVITLTLSDPVTEDKYTLGTNKILTINVKDSTVPTITIANADSVVAPNNATFTLTAVPQPKGPLTIRVTPTETSTNTSFLSPTFGTSTQPKNISNITFAPPSGQTSPITGTFNVQTLLDSNFANGVISIEVLADSNNPTDPTYQISNTPSENTGKVSVFSYSSIELSIEDTTDTATEGDQDITITVTADSDPGIAIPVSFTPTNTTGTYLKNDSDGNGNGDTRTEMLTFTNTAPQGSPEKWQDTFTIGTNNDNTHAANGAIEVKLVTNDSGNYTVKAAPDDHVDLTILDASRPEITMGETEDVH